MKRKYEIYTILNVSILNGVPIARIGRNRCNMMVLTIFLLFLELNAHPCGSLIPIRNETEKKSLYILMFQG